ncbi:nucleotidyltransferase family protein [Candidatus Poribacteria bacterium]|jgi:molybdenum cofactor cytidylyltransferase|nr:nucleotidyltransferase family protein [Candidatus Poribacteria bacterium]MBT5535778.1 nucleotidyltransferase family protein [Candidatus Poribacteria bacterium]MBT5711807.1 nucleotidyltransferase family protein [Candidatus Poribacteria bacterium]MBT7099697.1 nucleotidyltransferase family protein [Candidatus Poribacteria bacterium]MBT7805236.1 nucleotidyltransferase family protein [Candidatus Poribacteria bacterium]
MRVVGLLLAAGASRRMGRLKQVLPFGEAAVLEQGVANFRDAGVDTTIVVLGHAPDTIRAELPAVFGSDDVVAAVNERHAEGMFTSVQCGIRAAEGLDADAVLLALVDQPFIPPSVYASVIGAHADGGALVTIPVYRGRRGHPVALSMDLRDQILAPDEPDATLRDVVRANESTTRLVTVDADEILRDMDRPDDYARELARWLDRPERG